MATTPWIEQGTCALGVRRSIQLSYVVRAGILYDVVKILQRRFILYVGYVWFTNIQSCGF